MPRKNSNSADSSTASKPWVDPDDAPEFTDELVERFFATAEIREGDRIIRPGNPPLDDFMKEGTVTLRLDPDVLESYRAFGAGWQTQINADLRRARKLKKA